MGNNNSSSQGGSPLQAITKRDLRGLFWRNGDDYFVVLFVISMLLTFMSFQISYMIMRKRWGKANEADNPLGREIG